MRIYKAETLRKVLEAVEQFERAEQSMRAQWPTPSESTVTAWNSAKRAAERACERLR
jgi:hypothetical protein